MADLEFDSAVAGARAAANAASFDVQKLPEDSIERQALHGIVTALDYLIQAVEQSGADSD